ncbi:hypothetical protein CR513_27326, partial [Mucuna pruriens]
MGARGQDMRTTSTTIPKQIRERDSLGSTSLSKAISLVLKLRGLSIAKGKDSPNCLGAISLGTPSSTRQLLLGKLTTPCNVTLLPINEAFHLLIYTLTNSPNNSHQSIGYGTVIPPRQGKTTKNNFS